MANLRTIVENGIIKYVRWHCSYCGRLFATYKPASNHNHKEHNGLAEVSEKIVSGKSLDSSYY